MTTQQAMTSALENQQAGRLAQAESLCRQVLSQDPNHANALHMLGVIAHQMGRHDLAVELVRRAIKCNPAGAEYHNTLGLIHTAHGELDLAIDALQTALRLNSNYGEAYNNIGIALFHNQKLPEATAAFRKAVQLKPDYASAWANLGNAAKAQGDFDEAIDSYRHAAALCPEAPTPHSNLVYALHFHPNSTPQSIYKEHRLWNDRHAAPLQSQIQPHANDRDRNRRLRIGYVSPDFSAHPVGRFLAPLLAHHDPSMVEIFCYADVLVPDDLTAQLRSSAHVWRSITGLSDPQVADQIRADRIDILVDLTMHMARNRLLVFARKPAPVQVTYLAYCSTTGLDAIDYCVTDPYLDAPESDVSCYSEQSIWLKNSYWCYQAPPVPIQPGPLPALSTGKITFGCLNNFCKISAPCLACWSKLLKAIPDSSLLLHSYEGSHRQKLKAKMEEQGINPDRIRFVGHNPMQQYLALYQQMDIALDPFPYNGGTTSCDALWMGVPVISLAGNLAVSRAGLSILSNIGMPELVARSEEQYIQIAKELAGDLNKLSQLRRSLREKMTASPLMDAIRFAGNMESLYRQMWKKWCGQAGRTD